MTTDTRSGRSHTTTRACTATPSRASRTRGAAGPVTPTAAKRQQLHDQPAEWMADGLCQQADPEAWFPEKGGDVRPAQRVCAACPVRAECLEYALATDQRFGIWGGLSERARRDLRKARRHAGHDDEAGESR